MRSHTRRPGARRSFLLSPAHCACHSYSLVATCGGLR